jgi:ParB/RepB/Spo0J family partition protein
MARDIEYINPDNLIIMGLDEEAEESVLNDERATWDVDEALVKNIMVYGIQHPVLVRHEAGKIFVVDGRQRVKAARAASKRQSDAGEYGIKVPCIKVQADDSTVSGIMVSTNENRKDDTVLGRARKAQRLLALVGDEEMVAIAFGRSTKTIQNWQKLLTADPKIHEAIEAGKISASVGIELAGKRRQDQILALDQILEGMSSPVANGKKEKGEASGGGGGDGDALPPEVGSEDGTPEPANQPTHTDGGGKVQPGVKKAWLRKAVKTDAHHCLEDDQKAVIDWVLTGIAPDKHWLSKYVDSVEEEIAK